MAYGINEINQAAQSNAQSTEQLGKAVQGAFNAVEVERQKQNQRDYLKFKNTAYENIVSSANDNPEDPNAFSNTVAEQRKLIEQEDTLSADVRQRLLSEVDKISFPYEQRISKAFEKKQQKEDRELINQSLSVVENNALENAYSGGNITEEREEFINLKESQLINGDITEQEYNQSIFAFDEKVAKSSVSGQLNSFELEYGSDNIKTEEDREIFLEGLETISENIKTNKNLPQKTIDELLITINNKKQKINNHITAKFKEEQSRFNKNFAVWSSNKSKGLPVDPKIDEQMRNQVEKYGKVEEYEETLFYNNFSTSGRVERQEIIATAKEDGDIYKADKLIKLNDNINNAMKKDPIGFAKQQNYNITTYETNPFELLNNDTNIEKRRLEREQLKEDKDIQGDIPFLSNQELSVIGQTFNEVIQNGNSDDKKNLYRTIGNMAENGMFNTLNKLNEEYPEVGKNAFYVNRLIGGNFSDTGLSPTTDKKLDFINNISEGQKLTKEYLNISKDQDQEITTDMLNIFTDGGLYNGAFATSNSQELNDAKNDIKSLYSYYAGRAIELGASPEPFLNGEVDQDILERATKEYMNMFTTTVAGNRVKIPHANYEFNGGNLITHMEAEPDNYFNQNTVLDADEEYQLTLPDNMHTTKNSGKPTINKDDIIQGVKSGTTFVKSVELPNGQVGYTFIDSKGIPVRTMENNKPFVYVPSNVKRNTRSNNQETGFNQLNSLFDFSN